MYTYSPSDSIADFAQAANTIRSLGSMPVQVQTPAIQPGPVPVAAPAVDPIQRGIAALYAKGAELTQGSSRPMTFADGGSADKYYQEVLGLTGTPFYRRVLDATVGPSEVPVSSPAPTVAYTSVPQMDEPTVAEQVPSFLEETITSGPDTSDDGFAEMPGAVTGISPTTAAPNPDAFNALVNTPIASSLFDMDPETAGNISKGLSAGSLVSGLAGLPGVGNVLGLANLGFQSPISTIGTIVSAFNPGLGFAINAFGGLAGLMSDLGAFSPHVNSLTGQTQKFGWGNEAVDKYNNPRGSEMATAASIADAMDSFAQSMGPGVTVEGYMDEASGFGGDQGGYDVGSGGMGPGGPGEADSDYYAQGGGISALAYGGDTAPTGYGNPSFEGMVPGAGTGMSDSVPFSIEGQQPALLSRDEYVLPADVVSQLGDGSSGAGADMLDSFVSQVRQQKYGHSNQPPANGGGLMGVLSAAAGGSLMPVARRI